MSEPPVPGDLPAAVPADAGTDSPATVDELVAEGRSRLAGASFAASFPPSPREAALLLGHLLGWNEARVLARGEDTVPAATAGRFRDLLRRRLTGEPVAYLLGQREFYGRPFRVDPRVLIPRPDSEHLVEAALAALAASEGPAGRPRVLDVGTGSGCLAVTLALEAPAARVAACDVSPAALAVAAANARRLAAPVHLFAADLTAPHALATRLAAFDLVVSNLPYVDPADAAGLSPEVVQHEPALALFADGGGRQLIRRLVDAAAEPEAGLPAGGRLYLEVGHDQAEAVAGMAAAAGLQIEGTTRDYSGIHRVVRLRRPAASTAR